MVTPAYKRVQDSAVCDSYTVIISFYCALPQCADLTTAMSHGLYFLSDTRR